jgi:hypothetical protein
VAIFVGAAALGWRGSIWWLALGIAAHGLLWDLWHYGRTAFVPDWYTVGCLVTDVSLGVYVALQAPAFARSSAAPMRSGSATGATGRIAGHAA